MVKKKYSLKVVGTRLVREKTLYSPKPVTDPEVAIEVICDFLHDFDRETFGIICLSTKGEVNHISIVSIGNLNSALVSPSEVFKVAILSNANSVILFHNHPSGKCLPSDEDRQTTQRLCEAGEILGISVMDHIVVGGSKGYYSFWKNNEPSMKSPRPCGATSCVE